MTLIERVARAIHESSEPWDSFETDRREWFKIARAAVEAMRDPTEKMIEAGTIGWDALDGSGIDAVIEVTCSSCRRLVYRKEIRNIPNGL